MYILTSLEVSVLECVSQFLDGATEGEIISKMAEKGKKQGQITKAIEGCTIKGVLKKREKKFYVVEMQQSSAE